LGKTDGIFAFVGDLESTREDQNHKNFLCEKCNYGRSDCLTGSLVRPEQAIGRDYPSLAEFEPDLDSDEPVLQFVDDGWKSWRDVVRLYPSRDQRETRAQVFHRLKTTLCENLMPKACIKQAP
jgi:hypothetical protein